MFPSYRFYFFTLLALIGAASALANPADSWSAVRQPTHSAPEVIGGPAAGCLQGAQSLPPSGIGYQLMKLARNRFHGHPSLIHYLQTLSKALQSHGVGTLLIGDLSQPRGGPTPSMHRSHQNGLDVDIWFWLLPRERRLTSEEVESLTAPSMLTTDRQGLDPSRWSEAQVTLLRLAAAPEEIERIFVSPFIKRALCDQESDRRWLHKIRPWWGHDDHLHARLRCPAGDNLCQSQEPISPGDGCDEVDDWIITLNRPSSTSPSKPPRPPTPPPAVCQAVLHAPR